MAVATGSTTVGPIAKPAPAPAKPAPKPLTSTQTDAIALMTTTLASWGLSSLLGDVKTLIINGDTSSDTLALALSQTAAYKTRFAGNAIREKNGLADLTPAEYIATEEQYRNTLQSYGLPSGFYDKPSDFTQFIGNDISPAELDTRAKIAHDQYVAAPDYVKNLWTSYFGMSPGDAIAGILDPDVATSLIQDKANQVAIGGAAASQGLSVSQPRAQQFDQAGVTLDQAQKAYDQIAQFGQTDQTIASRFGTTYGQDQQENALLLGDASAVTKGQTLNNEETALFRGSGGANSNSLAVSQTY